MKQVRTVKEIKSLRTNWTGKRVGFVPTMGALHAGHLSLIQRSKHENDLTVVSIYLNETQFNDPKDLQTYPTSLAEDLKKLSSVEVDCVFLPDYSQMYPENYRYRVTEISESKVLCGKDRPGHFDGVLTVVLKLFNLIQPCKAYFGEKDYQQLSLIEGMVRSLFLNIDIVSCPTQRDVEGLALSSRNRKLSSEDLLKAHFFAGKLRTSKTLEELSSYLSQQAIEVDYLSEINGRRYAAVKIGSVRLIDNVKI